MQTKRILELSGDTGRLIAAFDWSATSLGAIDEWPQSLATAVALLSRSPVPIVMLWGADGYMIYNDAYSVFAGGRHPANLGKKVLDAWPEVADFNANVMQVGLSGRTLAYKDQELTLYRRGVPEQVWMNLDYSPVYDESGEPAGVIAIVVETTERVMAERRNAIEHNRFRQLFEQAPTFMAMLSGPEHRVQLANPGYVELIGHRAVVGLPVAEALPEAVEQGFIALLEQVYQSGRPFESKGMRYVMQPVPGGAVSERYLDFVYQPIKEPNGRVTGIFVVGADVTSRIEGERALRESEARFRGVTEAMPGFVWTADANGQLDYASSRWALYSGTDAEAGYGDGWATFVHRDDISRAAERWAASIASGELYETEFRLRRHDGVYRWWLVRAVAVQDDAGVTRWVGSAADIDAIVDTRDFLKRSSDALELEVAKRSAELRDSEARMRAVFATSHLYQGLLGTDGAVLDLNATALDGIGGSLESVEGRPFWDIGWFSLAPSAKELVRAAVERAAGGGSENLALEVTLPAGPRSFDMSIRPVRDASGAVIAVLSEAVDTTARRLAEDALRQSQKMEAMGQLTGGVAHDFNNLLTPIIGSLDMLQRRSVGGPRDQRLIDGALQAGERAKVLVQRLLAFARRQPLKTAAIDIADLVAGVSDLIASTCGPRIRLDIEVDASLPPASADANQLEMALLNLSVNARDAMPDGGALTISASLDQPRDDRPALLPGNYIKLAVTDTGTGMDEATRQRACEPFFSTKGIGRGTGLGLSMVHGLALQLGGAVHIVSEPGAGTRVELWLPVEANNPGQIVSGSQSGRLNRPVAGLALLVDDEDLIRSSTAEMLTELGYDVIEARSADEGLATLHEEHTIGLIVSDHLMPGMTGTELARAVREIRPDIPVLIISGYSEVRSIAPDLPRLAKPFRIADLSAAIAALKS